MTKRKTLTKSGQAIWVASALLFPFVSSSAAALVTIGDHSQIFFNGSATVRFDDNIFLQDQSEESDVIFILSPGLELNIGARQNANVNIFYREDFYLYDDNSHLDTNTSNIFLESYWNQARLDLRFDASFEQLVQATPELVHQLTNIDDLVKREHLRANFRAEYEISDLTSVAAGLGYSELDFKSSGFSDRETFSVPIDAYYALTPLVDLSIGYRFRDVNVSNRTAIYDSNGALIDPAQSRNDFTDHYFNVGARGELAPKLMGQARAGYQIRETSGGGSDRDSLSFGVDLSHFTTPNTTLLVGLFRDFDVGGEGNSVTRTGGNIGARHTFSHLLSGTAGVSYYERDYSDGFGREDETLDLHVGVSYSPITYVDLSATYIYRQNDSNIDAVEFDNNIFSISAALRY